MNLKQRIKIFHKQTEIETHCKGHYLNHPLCEGCLTCEHDYDKTNFPNNYDCPHFEPYIIRRIEE